MNFLQSATAAISSALSPVNDDVGSSSSSGFTSGTTDMEPMCEIDRSISTLLLVGLVGVVGRRGSRALNCGRRLECSLTSEPHGSGFWGSSSVCWTSGSSYRQKSTASRSDIRVRNRQATISHALARVSFNPRSSTSSVEKCHFNVLSKSHEQMLMAKSRILTAEH